MGVVEFFSQGFISTRREAAKQLQDDVAKGLKEATTRSARPAAESLGRDVFKPSAGLDRAMQRMAAPVPPVLDPIKVITSAEKKLEPAMLDGVPAVLKADPASAEKQLEGLYSTIATQATPAVPTSIDKVLGQQAMADAAKKTPEVNAKYPELASYVQGVIDRLTKAAGVEPYQLHLLETSDVNAFNAGGPSMAVLTGILPFMKNEAELAGVLGHEMTHGIKRHVIQGAVRQEAAQDAAHLVIKQNPIGQADVEAVNALMAKLTPAQQQDPEFLLKYLQGKVSPQVLTNLGFQENTQLAMKALQRGNESEADAGSARLLSKAGYDPNALITAFKRLPNAPGDVRFMDHPTNAQRIADLQQQITSENLAVGPLETNADVYQKAIAVLQPPAPSARIPAKQA